MSLLAQALVEQHEHITQRWYEAWRKSKLPQPEIGEAALKDHLSPQLLRIGEQMANLASVDAAEDNWKIFDASDSQALVDQDRPVEEVVMEYGLALDILRQWIKAQNLQPSFNEYSYLFQAIFELTAESVRRYQVCQQERLNLERSRYLAGLTHQMRTPISTLMMQMQLLERQREVTPSFINMCQRNLKRLSVMVDTAMRLERFKPQEISVRPQHIYPARLIDQSLDDYQHEARHKGLRLEMVVDRALDMHIDPDLFQDVLGSLIDNAIKYTSEGFVRVEMRSINETNEVLFTILDSGPGISADKRAELFGPAESGTLSSTGMGLNIAQRAVTVMGGSIGINDTHGQGAEIWFRLPRDQPA